MAVAISLCASAALGATSLQVDIGDMVVGHIRFLMCSLYGVFAVITYTLIFTISRTKRRNVSGRQPESKGGSSVRGPWGANGLRLRRYLLVPTLIIISFIVLYFVPMVLREFLFANLDPYSVRNQVNISFIRSVLFPNVRRVKKLFWHPEYFIDVCNH